LKQLPTERAVALVWEMKVESLAKGADFSQQKSISFAI